MQLTEYEKLCSGLLEECTGYTLQKGSDEDGEYYLLMDQCGDQDGDPWYEWDDLQDYLCNCRDYEQSKTCLDCDLLHK
jgi:hypothetical protein